MWKVFLFFAVTYETAAGLAGALFRHHHDDDEALLLVQQWWRKDKAPKAKGPEERPPSDTAREAASAEVTEDVPITLLGVETRGGQPYVRMHGFPGWNYTNAGAGKVWEDWYGRVVWYRDALQKLVEEDPEQMIIVADVSDVMYGGCSNHDLMFYYQDTVKHSMGSPVIFGATVFLTPCKYLELYKRLQYRADNVRTAASMPLDAYCADKERLKAMDSIGYSYLNAGFAMGPAERMLEVYQGMLDIEKNVTKKNKGRYDDQLAAGTYMLMRPDLITLDYTGRIVLTEDPRMVDCNNGELHVKREGNKLINTLTGFPACFVHGNGGSWRMMEDAWSDIWPRELPNMEAFK